MFIHSLLDLVYPRRCLICKKTGDYLCLDCRLKLNSFKSECYLCRIVSTNFKTHLYCKKVYSPKYVYILWEYNFVGKKILQKYKYSGMYSISQFIGDLILERIKKDSFLLNILLDSTLVSIPSHRKKLNERGFNQTDLLCRYISKNLNVKYDRNLVQRVKYSDSQTKKDKKGREVYVEGTFKWNTIPYKRIVILDDVLTTGSTIHTCVKDLKLQNPQFEEIVVLALFRSPHHY